MSKHEWPEIQDSQQLMQKVEEVMQMDTLQIMEDVKEANRLDEKRKKKKKDKKRKAKGLTCKVYVDQILYPNSKESEFMVMKRELQFRDGVLVNTRDVGTTQLSEWTQLR